jgi:carbon-monoxide dehydrogenase iron sulfur subunit
MAQKKIVHRETVFPAHCNGCRLCELTCSFQHYDLFNPNLSRIKVKTDEEEMVDYPVVCRQCDDPACEKACATGANHRPAATVRKIDESLCTGCGDCVDACPYDGVHLPKGGALPISCDLCDGEPGCVAICPRGVLFYGSDAGREKI